MCNMKIIRKWATFGLIFWKKKNACTSFNSRSRSRGGFQNVIGITRDLDMSTIDGCFSILAIRSFEIKKC